jgi:hypothetical protein
MDTLYDKRKKTTERPVYVTDQNMRRDHISQQTWHRVEIHSDRSNAASKASTVEGSPLLCTSAGCFASEGCFHTANERLEVVNPGRNRNDLRFPLTNGGPHFAIPSAMSLIQIYAFAPS